jgi:ABC-2 type transport system permease protein
MKLELLWKRRRTDYLREALPYWRYVLSSGGAAMGFLFILSVQGYAFVLRALREGAIADSLLPVYAAAAITAALLWNPVRTYMKSPDLLFMLPMEGKMQAYFQGARRFGMAASFGGTALLLFLYWPLYEAAGYGSVRSYGAAAAITLAVKGLLYDGKWREGRFRYRTDRRLFQAVKAIAAFATCYVLLGGVEQLLEYGIVLVWGLYAAAVKKPQTVPVHWEYLLQQEQRTAALHEKWFSFFVDLPHRQESYKPRIYLNGLLSLLSFRKSNAFLYLYWRTFLRSSMAVLAIRMIIIEGVLIALFPQSWTAVGLYGIFGWLLALQLRSIRSAPAEPLFAAMSPLPAKAREASQRTVQRMSTLIGVLLMAVPVFLVAPLLVAAGSMAVGAVVVFLFARIPRKEV